MISRHDIDFVCLCVLSLILWCQPLVSTLRLALQNDEYTHILLILPISTALILLEWRSLKSSSESTVRVGSTLLVMAVLIGCIARWGTAGLPRDVKLSVSMLALVMWWIAAFVLCFGTRVSRLLLFPLCFLFLLVPLPKFALNSLMSLLQQGSASATHLLFAAAGVPVSQDGVVLSIAGLTIEVARECSSIRSSLMLVVTSMVLAHLFLRSRWQKAVVILAAVPLSVAKNGLRIFTLSMLSVHVDPGFLEGRLHRNGGILFFALSVVGLLILVWLIQRAERKTTAQPAVSNVPSTIAALKAKTQQLPATIQARTPQL